MERHGSDTAAWTDRLAAILAEHDEFRRHVVPLCAAETPLSPFVRAFLSHPIHETYAMGGPLRPATDNFAGADFVLDLHRLVIELVRDAFGVAYADPRPLSGTHAVTTLLMTLSRPGQRILLQSSDSGGHASMLPICRRLGLDVVELPYDFDRLQVDVDVAGQIDLDGFDFVLVAPSDLLYPPALDEIAFPPQTIVMYDATQSLGLIAAGRAPNPFTMPHRMVLSAGTHKTLPGPSSGLIVTDDAELAEAIDGQLSPKFLRHSHPHHIAAMGAAMIEHRAFGSAYSDRIRSFARELSRSLEAWGLDVIQDGARRTETHQVFLHIAEEALEEVAARARMAGLTINTKRKPLFRSTGLRLGVQELARYQWSLPLIDRLAEVIASVVDRSKPVGPLRAEVMRLAQHNRFDPTLCLPLPSTSGDAWPLAEGHG